MKAHALTLSLFSLACSTTTTTTTTEEEVVEESSSSSSEPKKESKAQPMRTPEPMKDPAPSPQSNDDARCALKASREDCRECCTVIGGETCASACDEKPAANDCRNNGCAAAGESCKYCWTRYVCLKPGTIC
jgi:hypothetical protein